MLMKAQEEKSLALKLMNSKPIIDNKAPSRYSSSKTPIKQNTHMINRQK